MTPFSTGCYTGCLAIEMTLDHIGPMANNVENTARMLSVLVGPDPLDPRQRGTIPEDYVQDYMPAIGAGCEGIRIGVLSEGFGQTTETWPEFGLPGSEPAVDESVFAAVRRLEERGARRCHVNHRVTSLWAPTPEIMQRSSLAATVSSRRRGIGGVFGGRPDGVGR